MKQPCTCTAIFLKLLLMNYSESKENLLACFLEIMSSAMLFFLTYIASKKWMTFLFSNACYLLSIIQTLKVFLSACFYVTECQMSVNLIDGFL